MKINRRIATISKLLFTLCFFASVVSCFSSRNRTAEQQSPTPATGDNVSDAAKDDSSSNRTASTPESLRIITWNVYADPAGHQQRIPALLRVIKDANPDVIAFQEVNGWFVKEYIKTAKELSGYNSTITADDAPGGLAILSKYPILKFDYQSLPSRMRRGALFADIDAPGGVIAVATVHLDSFLEDGVVRAQQLGTVFDRLKSSDQAFLAGDFNFGDDEQPEASHIPMQYIDTWRALHPNDPGLTWNIEKSAMAKKNSFPDEPGRRLDRILVRSKQWTLSAIQIVGDAPLTDSGLFPSDHFGLFATFTRTATE